MKDNIIQNKSYLFALKIIKAVKDISGNSSDRILLNQLLRSGTSIEANIEETIGAQSEKDFYAKLSIAYSESRETKYWLRLFINSQFFTWTNH